jgi:hypothetical protein
MALAATACLAAFAALAEPPAVVYLNGAADLERLRSSNPDHYWKAERILAAADHLCRPGPAEVQYVGFDISDLACSRMLLKTSNPPKWQIAFRLDDTRYVALVTVTDDAPRVIPAH